MDIILYLLQFIQYQHQQICWLFNFICRYIPLRQWAFDDSHSPKYQKFKIDKLPVIKPFIKQDWQFLLEYYQWKYGKPVKPVQRRNGKSIPEDTICPLCGAPHHYIYDNNGGNGQYQCKICGQTFSSGEVVTTPIRLTCPHCGNTLVAKKDRRFFRVHKCVNPRCPYYLHNLKKVDKEDLNEDYGKNKYKLHYIYREFTIDFFIFTADETYIKIRGIKTYVWLIMNAATRSIIGYQVSDNRGVGPCIFAMRMAFQGLTKLPKNLKFIADGYSAYPLAAMEFARKFKEDFTFKITQVIGLTNDDAVSTEYRPFKQMIERLNRTYKASYRQTNGFDNIEGANYDLALWVAYYNFLRPHKHNKYQVLNKVEMLENADNMPAKWQLLIFLGQQTILNMQKTGAATSERSCCQ